MNDCPFCLGRGCAECDGIGVEQMSDKTTEPVAWMHRYRKITGGSRYERADIGEYGPDPDEGYEHYEKSPLVCAAPSPQTTPTQDEIYQLALEWVQAAAQDLGDKECAKRSKALAAAVGRLVAERDELDRTVRYVSTALTASQERLEKAEQRVRELEATSAPKS